MKIFLFPIIMFGKIGKVRIFWTVVKIIFTFSLNQWIDRALVEYDSDCPNLKLPLYWELLHLPFSTLPAEKKEVEDKMPNKSTHKYYYYFENCNILYIKYAV